MAYIQTDFQEHNVYLKLPYINKAMWRGVPKETDNSRLPDVFNIDGKRYVLCKLLDIDIRQRAFNGWEQPYIHFGLWVKTNDNYISDEKICPNGWCSVSMFICTEKYVEEMIPKVLSNVLSCNDINVFMEIFVETMYKYKLFILDGLITGDFTRKELPYRTETVEQI